MPRTATSPISGVRSLPGQTGKAAAQTGERRAAPSAESPAASSARTESTRARPLLLVDIDGVISLFGFPPQAPPEGAMHWIDGIPHFLSAVAARELRGLADDFELVWCSGWEERANEYLPHLLDLPRDLPFLRFGRSPGTDAATVAGLPGAAAGTATTTATRGHWKLAAIDAYAGHRPLAWIDDAFDEPCHTWAQARSAPTFLVQTTPACGLTEREALLLRSWRPTLRPVTRRSPPADAPSADPRIERTLDLRSTT